MAVNNLTFNQLSTTLNAIRKQVTGIDAIAPTDTGSFTSVAQTLLQTGYDPVLNAINQVLGRTIFSIRPYNRRFAGIRADAQRWGSITRKLNIVDKDFENDARFELTDGQSVDMYKVNKPEILQTNFYGTNVWQKSYTIFKDQLDNAFQGPEQFGSFLTLVTTNSSDMIEQANESLARATIANFIGGKVAYMGGNHDGVVHLLTEYNTKTGLTLTRQDIAKPDYARPFWQFAFSRIASLSAMMTERTTKFQTQITGKVITRHTPYNRQKVYITATEKYGIEAQVLADTYHDNYLSLADVETINYWQSPEAPDTINVIPTYLLNTGLLFTREDPLTVSNILGVIFDEEALGYTTMGEWSAATPFNAAGGYTNMFYHWTTRFWNDFTEKGIVLLLD